jgi:hypothetical protein
MTDFDDDGNEIEPEEDESGTNQKPVLDANIRKQLRAAEAATKELAELKRSVQFDKAGIPEDGLGTMFRKGYEGEVTVEAIKAKATEYGLLKPAGELNTDDTSNDSELEALRRAQGATATGDGPAPDKQQQYLEALANAKTAEEADAVVNGPLGKAVGVYGTSGAR